MKIIVWKLTDGRIAYTRPAAEPIKEETESDYYERIKTRALATVPVLAGAIEVARLSPEEMPQDELEIKYRDAWDWTTPDPKIDINLDKARNLRVNHLQRMRQPILEKLDVAYLRAVETNDLPEQSRIAARKQALRDITKHPDIALARTLIEIDTAARAAMESLL